MAKKSPLSGCLLCLRVRPTVHAFGSTRYARLHEATALAVSTAIEGARIGALKARKREMVSR